MHARHVAPRAPPSRGELYRRKTYFGRFSNFFFYPNGTWTHPPTSKLFLDFWNFFNFAKPLRNREAKRELHVMWNGTRLSNTTTPVYLGVHLDRTLRYKTHIEKTNMKVNARNNIIRKLANSKWGCKASTRRPSCLALCYSAAEYACPVWARSTHAPKLNPALHDCCRIISGCLKPTNLDSVHLLAGIAPPHTRRTVACRMERTRQTTDINYSITNQLQAD